MLNYRAPRWYFTLFYVVARQRILRNDLNPRIIHGHLAMVLSTGILMWAHAVVAWKNFSTPIPAFVGLGASIIHSLSPLLFLFTPNVFFVCSVGLGAAFAHTMTYAYFSGGFESCVLMWLPMLPILGDYIQGKRCLIFWMSMVSVAIGVYLGLHTSGYVFPMLITYQGYQTTRIMLLFGWPFILLCTSWMKTSMKEFSEENLRIQGQRTDDLFRVLFHDLANSLGRINIGMSLCEREQTSPQVSRGLKVIKDAQATMIEITQNVRRMYAVSKGKADVELSPCPLNECVEEVQRMFASELEKKKITVNYDAEKHRDISVIVEPVSFNNQVLGNLLSNAIKFSDPGGMIEIHSWRVNHLSVAVEIKDSGIGMPESILSALFDLNKRTSRQGTSGESGTGFGMHIMKSFVEMYHGQVQVQSIERTGSGPSGTSIRLILNGSQRAT